MFTALAHLGSETTWDNARTLECFELPTEGLTFNTTRVVFDVGFWQAAGYIPNLIRPLNLQPQKDANLDIRWQHPSCGPHGGLLLHPVDTSTPITEGVAEPVLHDQRRHRRSESSERPPRGAFLLMMRGGQ